MPEVMGESVVESTVLVRHGLDYTLRFLRVRQLVKVGESM